ncbi:hypothetical protein ANCCEY_14819 [Ancylostoma ceylanicum]|uniref:SHSP domain-containing protein n=1 Tax=Ancylostoma ceylanicum TaxID=53326 RepID=A0A0D6L4F8_9BILA|nr:hypothetical protein ANCCEY_14819 [Ancylostoma ceylanicum]
MSIPVQHNKQWDWPLQQNDEFVKIVDDSTHFEVDLDAKYFAPKEIEVRENYWRIDRNTYGSPGSRQRHNQRQQEHHKVKTIGELIEIHMDHQARGNDITNVSRSITRCYKLPSGVDPKTLKSNLDNNGILHISAMKH